MKEAIAKAPSGRVRRTGLGRRNVLTAEGKEPGYTYRFVNDSEDRVQEFLERGYEIVQSNKVKVGDKRVDQATPEGSVSRHSVGGGVKAILMRQKDEYYKEDQQIKQDYVAETERATKEKALDGNYGKLDSFYKNGL